MCVKNIKMWSMSVKNLSKHKNMNKCNAKTRSGDPCKRIGNPINGRCHLHGGKSTGPKTAEGRARIAAAHYKHGNRSKAFVAAQRARAARVRAIRAESAALEAEVIREGVCLQQI